MSTLTQNYNINGQLWIALKKIKKNQQQFKKMASSQWIWILKDHQAQYKKKDF